MKCSRIWALGSSRANFWIHENRKHFMHANISCSRVPINNFNFLVGPVSSSSEDSSIGEYSQPYEMLPHK